MERRIDALNGKISSLKLDSIEYKSLSEITAAKLREAIIIGEIGAGERITETEISETLCVSRVVVREAILMLMREGLLLKERKCYTKVVEFHSKDVDDVFDLRIAIEQAAAKRCLGNMLLASELEVKSKNIQKMLMQSDHDKTALMNYDMQFHNHIVNCSNNSYLVNVWHEISGPLLFLLFRYINIDANFHYSHDEIIQALRQDDENLLMQEIKVHINDTKYAVMKMLDTVSK